MHDAAFSKAALPATARVLGLTLKPYSIGHELWLLREGNPLALNADGGSYEDFLKALPQAVVCCSQSHGENCRGDWLLALKFFIWFFRIRKSNFAVELAAFAQYRTLGTRFFPNEPPDASETKGRPLGQPLLLGLHQLVLSLGESEWRQYGNSAWDYPYGLAQMRYAARAEMDGRLKIKNAVEVAEDDALQEWEKAHPESTLKKESADA